MKKLSTFYKTLIVTLLTLLSTLLVFFLISQIFVAKFLNDYNAKTFQTNTEKIIKEVRANGINPVNLFQLEHDHQLSIIILHNDSGTILYPNVEATNIKLTEEQKKQLMQPSSDNQQYAIMQEVTINNDKLQVFVSYNVNIQDEEFGQIITSLIPYLILIGLIISLIISYLYARYQDKKIAKLTKMMKDMEGLQYKPMPFYVDGDEFVELQNSIDYLYRQLMAELDKVKLFEKDREMFMRGTIHELKTPIMSMMLQVQDQLKTNEDEEMIDVFASLYNRLEKMSILVSEVLKIAKVDTILDKKTIQFLPCFEEVMEMYDYMIEDKNLTIHQNIEDFSLQIQPRDLKIILSNIISNAIKYSSENDEITINLDDYIFTIINETDKTNILDGDIFQAFVRNHEDEQGHGLGLFIVSTLMKRYGYTYNCDIVDNKFYLHLIFLRNQNQI